MKPTIKRVNILGVWHSVTRESHLVGDVKADGLYDYDGRRVRIQSGMSDFDTRMTLVHEILHGVLDISGVAHLWDDGQKTEHAIIEPISRVIASLMRFDDSSEGLELAPERKPKRAKSPE